MNPKLFVFALVLITSVAIFWRCLPWGARYEVRYFLRRHWWVPLAVFIFLAAATALNSLVSIKLF